MNKFAITTILVATVLVAGIFAFMPVEQASTVHTTIQDSQVIVTKISSASTAFSAADSATDSKVFTLNPTEAFVLHAIIVTTADNDATSDGTDKVDVIEVTIDGIALSLGDFTVGTTGATLSGTSYVCDDSVRVCEIRGLADKIAVSVDVVNDATGGGTITPNVIVDFIVEGEKAKLGSVGVA